MPPLKGRAKETPITDLTPAPSGGDPVRLRVVKAVHTLAWAFFVASIAAVPTGAWIRRFDLALLAALAVLFEVGVLIVNDMRCPLTAIAARYTSDRRSNFDIYLPEWLARWNKEIFGTLFVLGLGFAFARWMGWVG